MVYLVIMFIVAAAGITRLWLQQRKERSHLDSVDGFRESLESIQPVYTAPALTERPGRARALRPERAAASAPTPIRHTAPTRRSAIPKHKPLDPERRAAAKRRLEARRKARSRAALQ